MEEDTRGDRRAGQDAAKRRNQREIKEREYKKEQRALQSQGVQDEVYEPDDSERFLKKMKAKEEKNMNGQKKASIYEQEMEKCMPKLKGKHQF